jgi:hypothetical protein
VSGGTLLVLFTRVGPSQLGCTAHPIHAASLLSPDEDFLNEFYADNEATKPFIVILTASEPSRELRVVLGQPCWRTKTRLLYGSALVMVCNWRFISIFLFISFFLGRQRHWFHAASSSSFIKQFFFLKSDLERARVAEADAVFLLAERRDFTPAEADSRTILRSWAINDYHPSLPQYVQLLLPKNKVHIESIHGAAICIDELRFAMFSMASTVLGSSTLVS